MSRWLQSARSTRRRIPEDGILHSHRRENLKSYSVINSCCCRKKAWNKFPGVPVQKYVAIASEILKMGWCNWKLLLKVNVTIAPQAGYKVLTGPIRPEVCSLTTTGKMNNAVQPTACSQRDRKSRSLKQGRKWCCSVKWICRFSELDLCDFATARHSSWCQLRVKYLFLLDVNIFYFPNSKFLKY
jgi:hypothetical protein